MGRYEDNSQSIGNSPLIKLNRVVGPEATVLAKIEGRNPAYSVKDRIGAAMIWDAEKTGTPETGHGDHRADFRQHGHLARLRGRRPRLQAAPHHAGEHEHRAQEGVEDIRARTSY